LEKYYAAIDADSLPLGRGYVPTKHQLLVREMILLLKRGYLEIGYFRDKFGVDIYQQWAEVWDRYETEGRVTVEGDSIKLTREGLLRADALLPPFFEAEHQGVRYT
jgi:oxygen-independent coproporphyrinogen-3 oxidase